MSDRLVLFMANIDKLYKFIILLLNVAFASGLIIFLFLGICQGAIIFYIFLIVINIQFFCLFYILTNNNLVVFWGLLKFTIKFESIIEIKKTANTFSSLATARNRIEIRYITKKNTQTVYISPKNENEFLSILTKSCIRLLK